MQDSELPLVSIVIPTYNHKRYVWQAVEAALAQTYPDCEVIVVDDGSTDSTGAMLRERYGERIRYVYQENRGLPAARNAGTQAARGEFINYCDADDQLLPLKVERCMAVFRRQPGVTLVYTDCNFVQEDGRTVIPRPHLVLPSGDVFCELLAGPLGNFVSECAPLIRRQAVLDVGGFNESLPAAEDWDLWLRLAARHTFAFVNEVLALYRMSPNAMHTDRLRMVAARLRVIQMARNYPGRERCLDDAAYDQLEAGRHHLLAMVYWAQGSRRAAREHFHAAIRLDPAHTAIRRLYMAMAVLFPARAATWVERVGAHLRRRGIPPP
jgi:glycosyltransferase involved in cell wall biosynthesis